MDKEIIFKTFFKCNSDGLQKFQDFSQITQITKLTIGFHFTLVLMFFYTAQTLRINRAKVTIGYCFTLKRERPK